MKIIAAVCRTDWREGEMSRKPTRRLLIIQVRPKLRQWPQRWVEVDRPRENQEPGSMGLVPDWVQGVGEVELRMTTPGFWFSFLPSLDLLHGPQKQRPGS